MEDKTVDGGECKSRHDGCSILHAVCYVTFLVITFYAMGKMIGAALFPLLTRNGAQDDIFHTPDYSYLPNDQCGLYLAPSTLPHAGLGVFSGSAIPFDHSVNEYIGGTFPGYDDDKHPPLWTDLFIPIADDYKALPYRGQQRFPSWLQYIWPKSPGALSDLTTTAFPNVPHELWDFDLGLNFADGIEFFADDFDDKRSKTMPNYQPEERVNAFVPGLASLANSDSRLSNMDRIYANSRVDYNGQVAPWQPGAGAYTPHHGIEFSVSKKGGVYAGMELASNDMIYSFGHHSLAEMKHSSQRFFALLCLLACVFMCYNKYLAS